MKRPRFALPFGINLRDYSFVPSREEKLFDRLRQMEQEWTKADDQRRRERARQIAAEVEQERIQQKREIEAAALQQEIAERVERDRQYWLAEREKGAPLMAKLIEQYTYQLDGGWRKKMQAKLDKLKKEIDRDAVKAEREKLAARGVIRGRRR